MHILAPDLFSTGIQSHDHWVSCYIKLTGISRNYYIATFIFINMSYDK